MPFNEPEDWCEIYPQYCSVGGGNTGSGGGGGGNTGNTGSGGGTYSQTLQAILSGLALWQRANYIPTQLQQGQTPYGATPPQPTVQYLEPTGNVGATPRAATNAFGGIQQYIQDHPLPVLVGVVLLGALLMKPPVQRARY